MNESPKILIVSDEPMLLVDLLYELEGRGFAVLPGTRGDYSLCSVQQDIDVAVFDLRHPGPLDMKFVSGLRHAGIPVIMFHGGSSTIPVEISGAATCISKPVDYDELTVTLQKLACRRIMTNAHSGGGVVPLSQSIPADRA